MNSTDKNIIHQGNSVITFEILSGYSQPVVLKKSSDLDSSSWNFRSLEREYEMTRSLDSVEGVRKVLGQKKIEEKQVLILEYIEGETLQDHISGNKLDIRSKLEIVIDLARILGDIHQQNIIHLDINSKNILIGKKWREVYLIDLGSASIIDRNGKLKVQPDQPLENLFYISPEQTGRLNRAMDERSDLYSLGVVLYELMTGQLPFDSIDPMELVHHHIARVPDSPSEVRSEIPKVLSAIILKLLAKNAEERYQSVSGIQADLEKCLQGLGPDNTIEVFPLGETDYATRLRFPQKLYGRDRELEELVSAFESVCRGNFSIVFVGGYSGIGKTVLVEEIRRQVSEKNGFFIQGKFDQLITTPYSGITQALAQFVSQILTQTETQLSVWRSRILETAGPNGRVLTDIVPSLELVIGPQPAVPDLSGKESQNRFDYVFQRFFGAIVRSEHPMCFFLDDLQWIDPGSLGLLKALFTSPDQSHLFIVGAYRDNEVNEDHPLMTLIADLEKADVKLNRMTLQKLAEEDVDALISNALRRDPGEVQEIARLVYSQTDGNPFFTRQVLRGMEEEKLIALDTATGHWRWDMDALRGRDFTASVVELLVGRLKELPVDILETLKVAASIGNQFDIATLTVVTEGDNDVILDHVREAVVAGLLWEHDKRCYFLHDRVQEAAYTLVPPEDRDRTHLTIGRLLLADTNDTDLEERILEIVTHYNQGVNLLTDPSERLELVRLNLVAGRKARLAAAFAASAAYLKQGFTLLGEGAWQDHYDLTLDVHCELIEVCYLNIQHKDVEALFDAISENVKQDIDAGVAHRVLIMSWVARHELGRAISLAENYLERMHITLDSERESNLPIAELYEFPQMEDKEKLAAMEVLMAITTPVIFSAPERLPSVINTMLNLVSRYGNNTVSGFAYSWYATNLCLMQQYQEGNLFGQLAVDLLTKYPHPGRAAEIMNMHHAWIRHWGQSVHDQITPLRRHHQQALQSGDFEWALYCLLNYTLLIWGSGKSLDYYLAEVEPSIVLCRSKDQQFSLQSFLMFAQSVLNLTGRSSSTTQLEGKWFSEETMMSRLEGNHMLLTLYGLLKMKLCYLFGDLVGAYDHIDALLKYRASLNPHYLYTKISFYGALSCTAGPPDGESDADRQERLGNLTLFEEELKLWAKSAPMNYQHQYDLVMAEKCRISDKQWEAVQLYEKAIRGSQENKFLQDEALANELYGQFWLDRGNDKIAEMYMREARTLYHQWGAAAKVDHLDTHYPQWFKTKTILTGKPDAADSAGKPRTTITQAISSIQLDLDSITSATQMLSAETDLNQLLIKMINVVMANSGAETAVLLLKQDTDWFVQARGDVRSRDQEVLLNQPLDSVATDGTGSVPESVHLYCRRSQEVLVVGDARSDDRFAKDKTVQARNIKSIVCIPVMAKGECKSILYLENCQVPDTFSEERIELLKHLSSQFGISVENALLNATLNKKIQELEESELLFRSFVENANETIVVAQDATIKYCNEKIRELTDYTPAEIRSLGFDVFIHPEDLEKALSELRARVSGQKLTGSYTIRIITKNGKEKHIIVNSGMVNWENKPASLAMLTDITELKQTEANLFKSEKQFRRLMEQSPLAIELLEPNGQVRRVNRAWRKLWGVSKEDATRVLAKYNMLTDPQIKDQGLAHLVEKAFSGQSIVLPPFQYDANQTLDDYNLEEIKGLKQAWIQCHLYSIKDSKGEILQVVNIYVDITELKYAEMEAQKQKEMLALVGRASRMGQLTGSIAHELNQPLTGILSNAQAAELMMKRNLLEREEFRDIIGDIISDTKRAGEVIRNLRDLYREQKIEFHPIDINSVLDDALRLLHSEFIIQHVKLSKELVSSLPPVHGNRVQIQQVLVNLFMNSLQALSDMAHENRQIHVKSAFHKKMIYVWIEDNGTGIKPEKIDQIFEPLTTWKPDGTGMGLAISKSIIESHGGKMRAENRDEGGARVGFTLPVLKEDKQK